MVLGVLFGLIFANTKIVFICLLTIFLFFIISFFEKIFKLNMSYAFKNILFLFVFVAEILGELLDFYSIISFFDNILHYSAGFISACFGLSIIAVFIRFCYKSKSLAIIYFVFTICFSMTIGIVWEFFEFNMDKYFSYDMQKDTYVNSINSVSFNEHKSNNVISIKDIIYTNIYTKDSVIKIDKGYLDIGLIDTIYDLVVNMLGAITFGVLSYLYLIFPKKFKFIEYFIVTIK